VTDKLASVEEALTLIPDGAAVGLGGVLLKRKPIAFLSALVAAGRRDLRAYTFLASLDVELLSVYGSLAEVHAGYVGFEHLGFAPGYDAAVASGEITRIEYSEFMFVAGLRAAAAGLPFMPAKGGSGSELLDELGFVEIDDPYGGEAVIAVPALRPEVSLIHADAADARGNVLGPARPDFLSDSDVLLARASDRVIVTCERVLSVDELRDDSRQAVLYGYEVDAIVHLPDGAHPTAMPGHYPATTDAIRSYLMAATPTEATLAALVGRGR
jgi:glutaconate CoA-transferase subunit A